MRVSTQFPIAFHALLMIARFPDRKVTSDMVAASAGCNAVIIRNIFTKLKAVGLLSVKAGRGETTLAKPQEEITLWDIYAAIESEKTDEMFKIHANMSGACPVGSNVRSLLLGHLDDALNAMKKELSKVTLKTALDELGERLCEGSDNRNSAV